MVAVLFFCPCSRGSFVVHYRCTWCVGYWTVATRRLKGSATNLGGVELFVWSFVFVMIPRGVQIVMNHSTLRGRCVNCGDDRRGDSATKCPKWGFADEGEEGLVCSCWVVQVLQAARSCARSAPLMMPLRSKSPRHTCSQAGPGGAPLLRLLKIQ
jgi:hypothetical protein